MRDHSRSSTMTGSVAASRRKHCGSVRKAEAITSPSRLSSLAPAGEKRSREAIHLFGIDGVHREATLHQRLDHGTVRHLDGDLDLRGLERTTCRHQPGRHGGESLAAMPEHPLAHSSTLSVREEHMMALRRPVDAGVPLSFISHVSLPFEHPSRRDPNRSLYWRSEGTDPARTPHGASIAANPEGHMSS